jgi:hypothetical protein
LAATTGAPFRVSLPKSRVLPPVGPTVKSGSLTASIGAALTCTVAVAVSHAAGAVGVQIS